MATAKRTEFWRMGLVPIPVTNLGEWARSFEASGWDGYAVGEGYGGGPDPYVVLATVAANTSRIKLGTSTAVPLRHPLAAANAMTAINTISGGRARFSIARGDSAYLMLGERAPSVKQFEIYLTRLQAFLRGEDVEMDNGFTTTMRTAFKLDPSLGVHKPPVDVACTGPRMIELGARLGDSVSFSVGADEDRLRAVIAVARDARRAAGLDPDELSLGAYIQMSVAHDGDLAAARETIRGLVLTHAHFTAYDGQPLNGVSESDGRAAAKAAEVMNNLYRGDTWRSDNLEDQVFNPYPEGVLDAEFIDRFAIVGSPEHCAERLSRLMALGIDRFLIATRSVGTDLDELNTATIANRVLPLARASQSDNAIVGFAA
jgi:5,10-methylenetetrahydromethanopterin reductase